MDIFEQILNRHLAPRLRDAGFTRRGSTWSRRRGLFVHQVNLQRSRTNSPLESRFTVNLAATLNVAGAAEGRMVLEDDWVSRLDRALRPLRIGWLRPGGEDHWYRYRPDDPASVEAALQEAAADLDTYGLPHLDAAPGPRRFWLALMIVPAERLWRRISPAGRLG